MLVSMRRVRMSLLAVLMCALGAGVTSAEPKVWTWREAEAPGRLNVEMKKGGGGSPYLLSGDGLLSATFAGAAFQQLPAEGVTVAWNMDVPEDGEYEVWARVTHESVRPDLRWKLGDGGWTDVPRTKLTTNLMQLGTFYEVAWLLLGKQQLKAGKSELVINYPKKEGVNRFVIGLDAVALTKGHWVPEKDFKPGETYSDDVDKEAAAKVYDLPEAAGSGQRSQVELSGLWQLARYDDPDMEVDRWEPVTEIPSPDVYPLRWMAVDVPSNLWNKEAAALGHRVFFRTRVNVPASMEGRGFKMHFKGTNMIASVFVNGKLAGTRNSVWVAWDLDVSRYVKPGEVNEITIGIKGHYYAIDNVNYKGLNLNELRNLPNLHSDKNVFWLAPIYPSTKGDGPGNHYGIVNPVQFIAVGNSYVDDVFIKPSVEKKRIETDVTVRNTGAVAKTLQVTCEAVNDASGDVEKSFGPVQVAVQPGETQTVTVAGDWADPKLWWPQPNPNLYRLRTTVREGTAVVDVQEELFGFREVTIKGTGVYINGVRRNFWNWVNVAGNPVTGEQWLDQFHKERNRFTRFSYNRKPRVFLPAREDRLEFYDRNGIAGRLCTMIDGMFITQVLGQRSLSEDGTWKRNEIVWENYRNHMAQVAQAYRNHPSVIMYQAENELVYITGTLRYANVLDEVCQAMFEVCEAGRAIDPTRPYTVGGGGALHDRLPINGPHYPAGSHDWYPENTYTLERFSDRITTSGWAWKKDRPWQVGESAFANELAHSTYVLGDAAFKGRDWQNKGKAMYLRMLYGGYRWAEVSGFFPWDNLGGYEDADKVFHDLYVIPRRQTSRLYAGAENRLLFKVMNDTLTRDPITFEWSYEIDGKRIAGQSVELDIEPGFGMEQELVINAPATDHRLDGVLKLRSSQKGNDDPYEDVRLVPVLPKLGAVRADAPVIVFDRSGKLTGALDKAGTEYEVIDDLSALSNKRGVLVIGPDTLKASESFGQDLLKFAVQGNSVVSLEQEFPVAGRNLPVPIEATSHYYGYVHPQALGTPIFRDLGSRDLIDWAAGHPTVKQAFIKPTQGARSLAECGVQLVNSALIEVPTGAGAIVLCQLMVGANLGVDPAADVLLRNMIQVYSSYKPSTGVAAIYAPQGRMLVDSIRKTGVRTAAVQRVVDALNIEKFKALVLDATPETLAALLAAKDQADAFQKAGGWIMLHGLAPDGIDAFKKLTGSDHMIRPFLLERVTLESPDYPLAATLGNRDVAMLSPTVIQHGRKWMSPYVFSHVIDGANIAPFTILPDGIGPMERELTPLNQHADGTQFNLVNGMLATDHWRYYWRYWISDGKPGPITLTLQKPETLSALNIWNTTTYLAIKDMDIIFDGDETTKVTTTLPLSLEKHEVVFDRPRRVEKTVTLQIRSWEPMNPGRPDVTMVGISNLELIRADAPRGVFLDSVGGLVAFPQGGGGIFLNQINFMDDEPNPENVAKKINLTNVLLQNMGVGTGGATVAVPGLNVRYKTINIQDWSTTYGGENAGKPGWFGQSPLDLRHFPVGERKLANVTYHVPDYATAPVPDCIMLGGLDGAPGGLPDKVEGIKVNAKGDMIFFLQAAKVTRPIRDEERARIGAGRHAFVLPEVARYVLHYADGKTETIPVVLEQDVAHWLQAIPKGLPGADAATKFRIEGEEDRFGVLYSMPVDNPRPDVEITTIDLLPGVDSRGRKVNRAVPALLGITLGTAIGD